MKPLCDGSIHFKEFATAPRIQLDAQRTLYHFERMHVRYRLNGTI